MSSADQIGVPPSFHSVYARDGYPASPSPLSQSLATPESSLPSSASSSTSSLPGYSDSLPVPGYRPNPTRSEQRLEFVPSRSLYGRSIGVWTKRIKDMTITLHNQDPIEIQRAPRYGKRGIILGTIEFDAENLTNFEKVKLVIEGQTSIGNSAYEVRSEIFVRKSFTLWKKLEDSGACPQVINFQIPFSAVGSRKAAGVESSRRLPPSYVCELGQGGKIVCSYAMHINVTQRSKHGFWTNRNRHVIPMNYVPWTRPAHSFPRDLAVPRSTIKAFPEAWQQVMTVQGAMSCNLFIPSVPTFCVTDEIPFFLQLVAPVGYLDLREGEEPKLQVSLQRQVGVSIQEVFIWKDTTSSQGVIETLPSGTFPPQDLDVTMSEAVASGSSGESMFTRGYRNWKSTRSERVLTREMKTWEWRGTVRNSGVRIGGCSTEVMVISDFFVFCVTVRKPNGQALEYHHAQPIEMVSETA